MPTPEDFQSNPSATQTIPNAKGLSETKPLTPAVPEIQYEMHHIDKAWTLVENTISAESLLMRMSEGFSLFPKSPYDVDSKTGEAKPATYRIGIRNSDASRRSDTVIDKKVQFSQKIVPVVDKKQMEIGREDMLIIPLPEDQEKIAISPGLRADGKRMFEPFYIVNKSGNYVIQNTSGAIGDLPEKFVVRATEKIIDEKMIIQPEEKRGVAERHWVADETRLSIAARVIMLEGKLPALVIEGMSGAKVQVSSQLIDRMKKYYEKQATREIADRQYALVTTPSPKHPLRNEDESAYLSDGTTIICDGMGGYEGGYEQSRMVSLLLAEYLRGVGDTNDPQKMRQLYTDAIVKIHDMMVKNFPGEGDATVVMSKIMKDPRTKQTVLVWANVGDSRAMVVRNGRVHRISHDDNVFTDLFNEVGINKWGKIADKQMVNLLHECGFQVNEATQEVFFSADQVTLVMNILDRFNGFGMFVKDSFPSYLFRNSNISKGIKADVQNPGRDIHSGIFALEKGDVVLRTTDGISDPVGFEDMIEAVQKGKNNPLQIARLLVESADRMNTSTHEYEQRKKPDDKTVIVEVVR